MTTLISIVFAVAVVAWMIAFVTAIQLFRLLPKGQRLAGYNDLGMWRFGKLVERIGPRADPLVRRLKKALIVFACLVLAGVLVTVASSALQGQTQSDVSAAALFGPTNGVSHA